MAKYKKSYKNNEFKISALTWNEEFELPDGSYSVSDIQKYFDHMLKNMEKRLGEGLNIIKNRITFEINTGYYLKFLTPEKKYLEALKVR